MADWHGFTASADRHHAEMCLFALVPPELTDRLGQSQTFVVDMRIAGKDAGRRTVKPWGDGRWFLELTNRLSGRFAFAEGDSLDFEIRLAPAVPDDLAMRVQAAGLNVEWAGLSAACRRAYAEPVFAARRPETRERRIRHVINVLEEKRGQGDG